MPLLSRLAVQAARAYGALSFGDKNAVPASYLVVAGGGGGGSDGGGGAGAGGLLTSTATLSTLTTYSITVGAGGSGGTASGDGGTGNNSVLSGTGLTTITSSGGGGGGGFARVGVNGGSGGGGGMRSARAGGTGISGQGFAGGTSSTGSGEGAGGGGGGASAVGGTVTNTKIAGNGGAGTASSISGSSVTYAGGGGGSTRNADGTYTNGTGGAGGGGNGALQNAAAGSGTANLGGGGGGGDANSTGNGGAGGSGVVIISYASATPKFIGGTITTSGGNQIHTFTSSGTLSPLTPVTASYLVVAGGGGAVGNRSGGGGAGGLLTSSTTLYSGATYVVTVGAGGAGGAGNAAVTSTQDGSNSVLSGTGLTTLTATGGGGGGGTNNPSSGRAGGSGGGAGGDNATGATGGTGISGQGFAGGTTAAGGGAGGGGASAVGSNGASNTGGNGGAGTASSITGTSVTYAGGGGGGATTTAGTGGAGGGGNGAQGSPTTQLAGVSGTQNLGGGAGGGSNYSSTPVTQASGGSGVVIISYAGSQQFNGGLVTSSGGNTIHTFNATGALTPLTNNLTNSLRFRSSASAYLNRTPTLTGNRQTFTYSFWTKLGGVISAGGDFISSNNAAGGGDAIALQSSSRIVIAGSGTNLLVTTQLLRDPSAWYHIVVAVDTTQATSANRIKLYINGNQVTAFNTASYPALNYNFAYWNSSSYAQLIGGGYSYFDGYMDDINFIDGQALEPYYFGNNDANGVWKPIKYTGMYGTNGFYLTFADTTSTTTLGYDSSGNNNNWTTNNISLTAGTTYDAMLDVPTNTSATVANYATLNPLQVASATLSNANLSMVRSATGYGETSSTFSPEGNKGYFEITRSSTGDHLAGFILNSISPSTNNYTASGCYWYQCDTGNVRYGTGGSTATLITGCTSAPTGSQIIMVAFDFTGGNRNVWFGLQGTWGVNASSQTGVPSTGAFPHLTTTQLTDICRLYFSNGDTNAFSINFGQRPFSYTPPSGFVALNTFNLPTPTILQGNKYMDATLYTSSGGVQVITNQGQFRPDFVWTKVRGAVSNHTQVDSVRGADKYLVSNSTAAEGTDANYVTSFNSNGFSLGSSNYSSGNTLVAWQWQAGQGTNTSNTSGTITSTVSVNTTAGFSVVTWTGNGTIGATIGHGLGVAPSMIIVKQRSGTESWATYHISLGATKYLNLNQTIAAATSITRWNNTTPSSTVITFYNDDVTNRSGGTYVAYCWAEIAGFSKFGSYTGNGSADGPFVYLGFRPEFVLLKSTTTAGSNWWIYDTARSTFNAADSLLFPNLNIAEFSGGVQLDILSNGFKFRNFANDGNKSGDTFIYAAFAEHPFKNSNAR